jgi:hypothetical protein
MSIITRIIRRMHGGETSTDRRPALVEAMEPRLLMAGDTAQLLAITADEPPRTASFYRLTGDWDGDATDTAK